MLKGLRTTGKYIVGAGMAATFLMAVVGTVSIDIVIFAYLIKKSNENNSGFNGFLTGYFWGTMFSGNHHHNNNRTDTLLLLAASPFLTGIAIGLSFLLGVPQVGVALAIGWGISIGIIGLGAGIIGLADTLINLPISTNADQNFSSTPEGQNFSSTYFVFPETAPRNTPNVHVNPMQTNPIRPPYTYGSNCSSTFFQEQHVPVATPCDNQSWPQPF